MKFNVVMIFNLEFIWKRSSFFFIGCSLCKFVFFRNCCNVVFLFFFDGDMKFFIGEE